MLRLLTDLGMGAATATDVYLLCLAALCLLWCAKALVAAVSPESPAQPYPYRLDPGRPTRLVTLEEAVEWGVRSAHVRDTRLRADVRFAVADRLGRAGIYLGSDPRADVVLGPTTRWLVESRAVVDAATGERGLDPQQVRDLTEELAGLDDRIERAATQGTGEGS
jgi:hypothetical protein